MASKGRLNVLRFAVPFKGVIPVEGNCRGDLVHVRHTPELLDSIRHLVWAFVAPKVTSRFNIESGSRDVPGGGRRIENCSWCVPGRIHTVLREELGKGSFDPTRDGVTGAPWP